MNKDSNGDKPTFSLVHGRYHSGDCWDYVREVLDARGYQSIATDLDIENGEHSLEDHAQTLAKAEASAEADRVIRVGWSWGANVIMRHLENANVIQLQFVSPSLHDSSLLAIPEYSGLPSPPDEKYSLIYRAWKKAEEREDISEQELVREMGIHLFYWDVKEADIINKAISSFRSHPRTDESEPALSDYPADLPKTVFIPTNDFVLQRDWLNWQARALSASRVELKDCGHSPMYSQPRKLARYMIKQAQKVS